MQGSRGSGILGYLALFTSFGTLLCCALPLLFVLLGLGATVASVVSSAPWLITLSRHKNWTFSVAGLLLASNFIYLFRIVPRIPLPADACPPDQPNACATASRSSRWILWVAAAIYLVGLFSAYLLAPILRYME